MIQQVEHTATGVGPADLALALSVAGAPHSPTAPSRAPELATARPSAGRRAAAARGRRRTVRG
ncbi:hypothetical protein [Streptomyces sp. AC550_RSS872]|uniref:hypothetical protein n=1 Tax=Streptomyces sp. AC550_RSS872 TaxID=2823689 RepID=UPI001C2702E2|nr:hypothetical protein [Streptomyces sp. AC550_RSS872]